MNATAPTDFTTTTRFCSICQLEVPRSEVRKDKKGRYTCRNCRAEGKHLWGPALWSHRLKEMRRTRNPLLALYVVGAAVAGLVLFGALDFFLVK